MNRAPGPRCPSPAGDTALPRTLTAGREKRRDFLLSPRPVGAGNPSGRKALRMRQPRMKSQRLRAAMAVALAVLCLAGFLAGRVLAAADAPQVLAAMQSPAAMLGIWTRAEARQRRLRRPRRSRPQRRAGALAEAGRLARPLCGTGKPPAAATAGNPRHADAQGGTR